VGVDTVHNNSKFRANNTFLKDLEKYKNADSSLLMYKDIPRPDQDWEILSDPR
jgi:hypothetical protein